MRNREREAGLSLVEALVAIVIFAAAAAAAGSMLTQAFVASDSANLRQHAVALAESTVEELRATPYDDLAGFMATDSAIGTPFTITAAVTRDRPVANMSEITATVRWNDRGRTKSYVARTIYTSLER